MRAPITVRRYGTKGPAVVLVHGGPGAPGTLAPVARALEDGWRVLEPLQRTREQSPLSVEVHLDDLHGVMPPQPTAMVGHSWGAMLALCYAARHPDRVERLVLVGCGTFDKEARAQLRRERKRRIEAKGIAGDVAALEARLRDETDPGRTDAILRELGDLTDAIDHYDALPEKDETLDIDGPGHKEAWEDMLRLQEEGVYPAAFVAVRAPVTMLHGEYDSHPGPAIRDSLAPYLRELTYRSFPRCGHTPWVERHAREPFLEALRENLRA
jgi:pimeloyl-ACP methyl ester carboxylesterase